MRENNKMLMFYTMSLSGQMQEKSIGSNYLASSMKRPKLANTCTRLAILFLEKALTLNLKILNL